MVHVRRYLAILLVVTGLVVAASAAPPRAFMPKVPTVFVTESGEKYHHSSCRHLKNSRKELALDQAKQQGYKPSKRGIICCARRSSTSFAIASTAAPRGWGGRSTVRNWCSAFTF